MEARNASWAQAPAQESPHVQFVYELATARVVFVNAAYARVLSGTVERVNEELPALLARVHPEDQAYLADYWARWQRGELVEEVEFRWLESEQAERWLLLTPGRGPSTGSGPAWVSGELRDITAPKHYKAHADRFNSRKDTLLEMLSQDLADCLSLAQGLRQPAAVQALRADAGRLAVLAQNGVQLIRSFVEEEIRVSEAVDLRFERVELGDKLRQLLEDDFQPKKPTGHKVALHLPPEPVYVLVDVNKFLQVVTNLFSNAIKWTPDGGHISLAVATNGGIARLAISDDGIGIPAQWHPHLFERPSPARRPGLRGEPGAGVGLALCRRLMELNQGTLRLASLEGTGTTAIIELPLLPA
jgi:two-component system sensor histidine kinase VicK